MSRGRTELIRPVGLRGGRHHDQRHAGGGAGQRPPRARDGRSQPAFQGRQAAAEASAVASPALVSRRSDNNVSAERRCARASSASTNSRASLPSASRSGTPLHFRASAGASAAAAASYCRPTPARAASAASRATSALRQASTSVSTAAGSRVSPWREGLSADRPIRTSASRRRPAASSASASSRRWRRARRVCGSSTWKVARPAGNASACACAAASARRASATASAARRASAARLWAAASVHAARQESRRRSRSWSSRWRSSCCAHSELDWRHSFRRRVACPLVWGNRPVRRSGPDRSRRSSGGGSPRRMRFRDRRRGARPGPAGPVRNGRAGDRSATVAAPPAGRRASRPPRLPAVGRRSTGRQRRRWRPSTADGRRRPCCRATAGCGWRAPPRTCRTCSVPAAR